MKSFKQHINEALDKPYPTDRFVSRGRGSRAKSYTYNFDTDDDRFGEINIEMDEDGEASINFNIDDSMSKTGGGDQFRIFATVGKAMDDFIKRERPDVIDFVGSKDGNSTSRQKLYTKFLQKLGKKYGYDTEVNTVMGGSNAKAFYMTKRGIVKEEWLGMTRRSGEIFKNPTPKEVREYASELMFPDDMAGVTIGKDVYLFTGGLHDELLNHLSSLGVSTIGAIKFRGRMTKSGRIASISPSGGEVPSRTPNDRKSLFMDMIKVYKHKYINKLVDGKTPTDFMPEVRSLFGYEKAYDEFAELSKKYAK